MLQNSRQIVDRLREFQRAVRDMIVRSRSTSGLHEVSRASAADTIYKIDTEVDPILEHFCEEWGKQVPLVLVAEGLENEHGEEAPAVFPRGTREEDALIRVIVDPIDGTRGIMYDKRAAWALAGVAPNKGPETRLRDIEVAVMTELPTSKMGRGDVLWAIKGEGAAGVRERIEGNPEALLEAESSEFRGRPIGRVLTKMGRVAHKDVVEALNAQERQGGRVGEILVGMGRVSPEDVQIALAFQQGGQPDLAPTVMHAMIGEPLDLRPSQAVTLEHGFSSIVNFFPGTKQVSAELMEFLVERLVGKADVNAPLVFDDQYISTGGQFYELIMGHDRFIADLRPAFYRRQNQSQGLCSHPYDCATLLIAEEAGVIITNEAGQPLDGPLDTTTGLSWVGYANSALHRQIEPVLREFLKLG